jgi:hypothetical protein
MVRPYLRLLSATLLPVLLILFFCGTALAGRNHPDQVVPELDVGSLSGALGLLIGGLLLIRARVWPK